MNQVQNALNAVPDLIRAIRADLVEKRLWPLAVLLVAAAVAIPVGVKMTSKGTSTAPPAPAPAPGAGVVASAPPASATPHQGHLGALHDPFAGSGGSGAATANAAGSTATNGTAVRVTPAGSAQGSANIKAPASTGGQAAKPVPAPVQPVRSTPHKPTVHVAAKSLRVYHVSFHFGQGTGVRAYSNVLRLTALPSVNTPVAQFLGVMQQGSKAAFLLWNAVSANGDGVCRRGKTVCDIVELKPGGSEFIDAAIPGSGTVQFELDVDSIKVTHASDTGQAIKAHAKQSTPGVTLIIKSTASALTQLKYSTLLGTLVSAASKAASATLHPHVYVSAWGPQPRHK